MRENKPSLDVPEDWEVPRSDLPEDHPLRARGVIVTKIMGAYDIRLSMPMHITLADEQVEGDIGKYASKIAVNSGKLLTNDVWNQLVPIIRSKLEEFDG